MNKAYLPSLGLLAIAFLTAAIPSTGLAQPSSVSSSSKPEIGVISRATGHLFREGLTAGFTSDSSPMNLKGNEHGLITSVDEGAYTVQLWSGLPARDLENLLSNLAPTPESPAFLPIVRRMLLTDAVWPDSSALQALRLEKMIEFGASEAAARLYSYWAPETPDPRLLSAGALALILAGQPSVACLEINVNAPRFQNQDAALKNFEDLKRFCPDFLAHGQGESPASLPSEMLGPPRPGSAAIAANSDIFADPRAVFSPKNLEELITLGPVALAAHPYIPRISYGHLTSWAVPDALNSKQAGILARDSGLPLGLRLKLYALSGDMAAPVPSPAPSNAPALAARDPDEIWAVVADLYKEQWAGAAQGASARARAILDLFSHLPPKIRALFVPTFEQIQPNQGLTDTQNRLILSALLSVDSDHISPWVHKILDHLPEKRTHDPAATALLLLSIMRGETLENTVLPFSFSQAKVDKNTNFKKILKNFSDLLDKPPHFIDNPDEVYEKKMGLTQAVRYVIPVQVLRNHLRDGREKGQIGRVLLASLLLLQTQEPKEIDPDVLANVLDGLVALGLREEARQIATTVFLGVTITGD